MPGLGRGRGREDDSDTGTDQEMVGTFETLRDEGEHFVHVKQYKKAIESFTKALEMRENDVTCLVRRAHCHLMLGNAEYALADSESALAAEEDGKINIKALYLKAEAFYQKGDFETALVFFHRGNKLRPELQEFRLGIQKSQEAINNSIGTPESVKLTTDGDLSFFEKQDDKQKLQQKARYSKPTQKKEEKKDRRKPDASSSDSKTTKELLGELYQDKEFLEKLFDEMTVPNNDTGEFVKDRACDGLDYLNKRADFWRQQKPMYARKRDKQKQTKQQNAKSKYMDPKKYVLQRLEQIDDAQTHGEYEESLRLCNKTMKRIENYSDYDLKNKEEIIANLHSYMGNAYLEMDNFKKAQQHHEKDLEIGKEYDLEDAKSRAYDNLGRVYARMEKYEEAINIWKEKLPLCKTSLEKTWLYHEIGRCHLELREYEDAKNYGERALEAAKEADDRSWQLHAYVLVAQTEVKSNELQSASANFEKALELAQALEDKSAEEAIKKALDDTNSKIVRGVKDEDDDDDRKSVTSDKSHGEQHSVKDDYDGDYDDDYEEDFEALKTETEETKQEEEREKKSADEKTRALKTETEETKQDEERKKKSADEKNRDETSPVSQHSPVVDVQDDAEDKKKDTEEQDLKPKIKRGINIQKLSNRKQIPHPPNVKLTLAAQKINQSRKQIYIKTSKEGNLTKVQKKTKKIKSTNNREDNRRLQIFSAYSNKLAPIKSAKRPKAVRKQADSSKKLQSAEKSQEVKELNVDDIEKEANYSVNFDSPDNVSLSKKAAVSRRSLGTIHTYRTPLKHSSVNTRSQSLGSDLIKEGVRKGKFSFKQTRQDELRYIADIAEAEGEVSREKHRETNSNSSEMCLAEEESAESPEMTGHKREFIHITDEKEDMSKLKELLAEGSDVVMESGRTYFENQNESDKEDSLDETELERLGNKDTPVKETEYHRSVDVMKWPDAKYEERVLDVEEFNEGNSTDSKDNKSDVCKSDVTDIKDQEGDMTDTKHNKVAQAHAKDTKVDMTDTKDTNGDVTDAKETKADMLDKKDTGNDITVKKDSYSDVTEVKKDTDDSKVIDDDIGFTEDGVDGIDDSDLVITKNKEMTTERDAYGEMVVLKEIKGNIVEADEIKNSEVHVSDEVDNDTDMEDQKYNGNGNISDNDGYSIDNKDSENYVIIAKDKEGDVTAVKTTLGFDISAHVSEKKPKVMKERETDTLNGKPAEDDMLLKEEVVTKVTDGQCEDRMLSTEKEIKITQPLVEDTLEVEKSRIDETKFTKPGMDETEVTKPVIDETEDVTKPGLDETEDVTKPGLDEPEEVTKPGLDDTEDTKSGIDEPEEATKPGTDETVEAIKPGTDETEDTKPGIDEIEDVTKPGIDETEEVSKPGIDEIEKDTKPGIDETEEVSKPGIDEIEKDTKPGIDETEEVSKPGIDETEKDTKPGIDEIEKDTKPGIDETEKDTKPGIDETEEVSKPGIDETEKDTKPGIDETEKIIKLGIDETEKVTKPGIDETEKVTKPVIDEREEVTKAENDEKEVIKPYMGETKEVTKPGVDETKDDVEDETKSKDTGDNKDENVSVFDPKSHTDIDMLHADEETIEIKRTHDDDYAGNQTSQISEGEQLATAKEYDTADEKKSSDEAEPSDQSLHGDESQNESALQTDQEIDEENIIVDVSEFKTENKNTDLMVCTDKQCKLILDVKQTGQADNDEKDPENGKLVEDNKLGLEAKKET